MQRFLFTALSLLIAMPATTQAEQWLTQPSQPRSSHSSPVNQMASDVDRPIYEMQTGFDAVIRGQSPQTFQPAPYGGAQPGFYDPNAPVAPPSNVPFHGGPAGQVPYNGGPAPLGYDPFTSSPYANEQLGNPYGHGVVGPQPVRFGWTNHWDFEFLSDASLGTGGSVSGFDVDWRMEYVSQGPRGWTWKTSPGFNLTNYNFQAPGVPAGTTGLADNYYRFSYRFEATSPQQGGPFSWRVGFTPAIASDLQSSLNSGGWNFDGDVTLFYRVDPTVLWVIGATFWDRADDFFLPNAGVVWTPNQFWEVRAVFPKPRVDVFIGTPWGIPTWAYAGAEYDVQSWQSGELPASGQLQVEETKAFAGFRWESGYWQSHLDFGYVFNRKYNLDFGPTSDLAPGDAFMMRYGFQY